MFGCFMIKEIWKKKKNSQPLFLFLCRKVNLTLKSNLAIIKKKKKNNHHCGWSRSFPIKKTYSFIAEPSGPSADRIFMTGMSFCCAMIFSPSNIEGECDEYVLYQMCWWRHICTHIHTHSQSDLINRLSGQSSHAEINLHSYIMLQEQEHTNEKLHLNIPRPSDLQVCRDGAHQSSAACFKSNLDGIRAAADRQPCSFVGRSQNNNLFWSVPSNHGGRRWWGGAEKKRGRCEASLHRTFVVNVLVH